MRLASTTVQTVSCPSVLHSMGHCFSKFLMIGTSLGYDEGMRRSKTGSTSDQNESGSERSVSDGPQERVDRPDSMAGHNSQSSPSQSVERSGESHAERLARIKSEIESGTYDTPEKLDLAIDRMLGRIMMD